jgi:hypothetical protein
MSILSFVRGLFCKQGTAHSSRQATSSSARFARNKNNKDGFIQVSEPYNFKHVHHIGYDKHTNQLNGFPKEWNLKL